MIEGKTIYPAGSSRIDKERSVSAPGKNFISRLKGLFHTAPAAISGDSGEVMEKYMKYRREHSGV